MISIKTLEYVKNLICAPQWTKGDDVIANRRINKLCSLIFDKKDLRKSDESAFETKYMTRQ